MQSRKTQKEIGELHTSAGRVLLRMWRVQVTPGKRSYYQHSHTRFEITVVDSGEGTYLTPNGELPMHPGDIFVFSSNEQHFISSVGEQGLCITNLHFEPRYLTEGEDGGIPQHPDFCFAHAADFETRIPAVKAGVLRQLLYHIADELTARPEAYALSIRSMLNLMLIDLIRTHGYAAATKQAAQLSSMLRAMAYIDEQFCTAVSLSNIAAAAGLTPTYFSALFKQLNGTSLWEYITVKRVEKAASLISSPAFDGTMLSVASLCGFNNTANFNKAFKKVTGMTPTDFRRMGETA